MNNIKTTLETLKKVPECDIITLLATLEKALKIKENSPAIPDEEAIAIASTADIRREDFPKIVQHHAKGLALLVNTWDIKKMADIISEVIETEHRTLNQLWFKIFQIIIEKHSKLTYFDERNKASVKWAEKVQEIGIHLPFI